MSKNRPPSYWSAIFMASLCCGSVARSQDVAPPPEIIKPIAITNVVEPLAVTNTAKPLAITNALPPGTATNLTHLGETTVVGRLDAARNQITADLGATTFSVSKVQIENQAQGENAKFDQVLLRTPGVVQDSLGQLHVRGEHANLQYRINDVLLPEGINGFGSEISPRFAENFRLITGSLPAQYGFRTAGVVDIHTKSGVFDPGGEASLYGGSYETINPSFEYGGSESNLNYYFDGSYNHNNIGIENPTPSANPIHDITDQYRLFGYLSKVIDDTSRISTIFGVSYSDYEVPNSPGQKSWTDANGLVAPPNQPATFDSTQLNERQNEQNYYLVTAYQKVVGDLNLQVAAYGRESSVHFMPDTTGDLFFNGVSSDENRHLYAGGLQADASYAASEHHIIRAGLSYLNELSTEKSLTGVYDLDGMGNPTTLRNISDSTSTHGSLYGLYVQDEWKVTSKFTLNYGARFDLFASYISENQISPRINGIYEATKTTTLHAGYARYFTPPPLEVVSGGKLARFNGTSNASDFVDANGNPINDPVKSERSHYFDAGISQKVLPGLTAGVDGYYKIAQEQLDDGLFGQTLIVAPFNYHKGTVEGLEFTLSYAKNDFSTFANISMSKGVGSQIDSGQSVVGAATVNYSQNNSIYLDHDQSLTGSFGASYRLRESHDMSTLVYADALYGSGLRKDGQNQFGVIPNGETVSSYYSLNLGVEQDIHINKRQHFKARLDVVNVTDNTYELRDGSGVGVNAAQFGERRGFFGSVSFIF